jgi:hypothetical protein
MKLKPNPWHSAWLGLVPDLQDIDWLLNWDKISSNLLPSYVGDTLEFANIRSFPAEWETGKIYVALDTNKTYRWSGSAYIQLNPQDLSNYYNKTETDLKFYDRGKYRKIILQNSQPLSSWLNNVLFNTNTYSEFSIPLVNINNYEITIPETGTYQIEVTLWISNVSLTQSWFIQVYLYKNGSTLRTLYREWNNSVLNDTSWRVIYANNLFQDKFNSWDLIKVWVIVSTTSWSFGSIAPGAANTCLTMIKVK